MKKKILLINAINPVIEVEQRYPSLGLGYLASSLRKHFGKDAFLFKIIDRDIEKEIIAFSPDLIGISSVSQNFNLAKKYAEIAKTKNIPVIAGGIHISMLPESLSKDMDLGCIGEGEITVIEIMELFLEQGKFPKEELKKIKGICYEENGKIVLTEPRDLIENLDSVPFPAREILKIEKHSYVFSSRGCPYRCVFCASSRYWARVRLFSAEYILKEIKELVEKYNVTLISFFDDLFIIDKERIEKLVSLLKKEKFYGKVKFTCSCRANLVNDDIVKLLKEMGVVSVGMGLESGCEKTLNYLKGGSVTVKDNTRAIKILKEYGISADASFIIGSPYETKAEMLETYNFIKKNPLDLVDTYTLTPLPGTPVWEFAEKKGLVSKNMNWDLLNINFGQNPKDALILSEVLDRKEIWKIYKKFQRQRFFRNLKNIWHHAYSQDFFKVAFRTISQKINTLIKKY
ncbi:MAG: radical SAM protein [Candidatus Pacebacteria bacterium]|nr:radical SAM protein [Candidatus Paceibacterota bacterium]